MSIILLGNYIKSRQEFQDKIVEKMLDGTTVQDSSFPERVCKTPTEPWIVFTAGVMVRFVLFWFCLLFIFVALLFVHSFIKKLLCLLI